MVYRELVENQILEKFKAVKRVATKVQRYFLLTYFFSNLLFHLEEADTDLETDRLLGQQRTDDQGFYDDKVNCIHISQSN